MDITDHGKSVQRGVIHDIHRLIRYESQYKKQCHHGIGVSQYHTPPPGRFSKPDCSTSKRVPIRNDTSSDIALGEVISTPTFFWHRHYSNCRHTDHGKSVQGGVIHILIVVHGTPSSPGCSITSCDRYCGDRQIFSTFPPDTIINLIKSQKVEL